jgi:hypothetical protein
MNDTSGSETDNLLAVVDAITVLDVTLENEKKRNNTRAYTVHL